MAKNRTDVLFAQAKLYMKFLGSTVSKDSTAKAVSFLRRAMKINKGQKVLDIACGYGRHSLKLAEIGCDVVGVDTSKYFLQQAKKSKTTKNIKFVQDDMHKIKYKEEFDHICNLSTSFGYFDDAGNSKVLQNFYKALKVGGKLCIDTINRDRILPEYRHGPRKEYTLVDTDVMLDEETFDPLTGCIKNKRRFIVKNKEVLAPYTIRLYTYTELKYLLESIGFSVLGIYGNFQGTTYSLASERLIVIAQK